MKFFRMIRLLGAAAAFLPGLGFFSLPAQETLPHLTAARALCQSIRPERNLYQGGPALIHWGRNGETASARCVCSSFVAALLRESYGLKKADAVALFGEEWPEVDDIARAVAAGSPRFIRVEKPGLVREGDFLLFDYRSQGNIPTGHIMLINRVPRQVQTHELKTLPFRLAKPGSATDLAMPVWIEWQVEVIDSTGSPHGKGDSRHGAAPGGADDTGVGLGVVRLFATPEGLLTAYSWSASPSSRVHLAQNRPIVIFRWVRQEG